MNTTTTAASLPSQPAPPAAASAILTIARKEWTELVRETRFAWAMGLLLVLLAVALLLGWQRARQVDAEHGAASRVSYQQWLEQGDKNPHGAAHYGQYAFKPQSALAFVDPGVDPYVGVTVWMEAHKQNEFRFRPARDATALQRFGDMTVAFVLQVLAPLLILLLGFSAFTGERERGTLRQLLGQGVRARELLAGKGLAMAGVMAVVLTPLAVLGVLAAGLWPGDHHDAAGALVRAASMFGAYAIYLLGFVALTLAVSALASSSRQALIVLLGFWVLNSFVAPRVATDLARSAFPTPSAAQFQARMTSEMRANFSGHDENHPGYAAFKQRVLEQYGVSRLEDLPLDFRGLAMQEGEENGYRVFDKHYGLLGATYERQQKLRAALGLVFPLLAMQPVSMSLAGNDGEHHRHFAQAAEQYRRGIQQRMNDDIARNSRFGSTDYVAGRALWEKVEPFHYQPPPARWALAGLGWVLPLVLLWSAGAALLALYGARRLKAV